MGIQITSNDYKRLTNLLEPFVPGRHEFEANLSQRNISKERFYRCLSIISDTEGQRDIDVEVLDISYNTKNRNNSTTRISILSRDAISTYCSNDAIPSNSKMMYKQRIGVYDLENYGIRFRLASETQLDSNERMEVLRSVKSEFKSYRLKKRVSVKTLDKFRFDFTIVKQTTRESRKFPSSLFASLPESYEIEIEYIGDSKDHKNIISKMFENLSKAIKALENNKFILSYPSIHNIRKEYVNVVKSQLNKKTQFDDILNDRQQFTIKNLTIKNPKELLIGPQPITLERKHLLKYADDSSVSIFNGYTVTEKADGNRALVFVSGNGDVYLLNHVLDVIKTGVSTKKYTKCVFDCEDVLLPDKRLICIWDTYYVNGDLKADLKLMSDKKLDTKDTRLSIAEDFVESLSDQKDSYFKIQVKDFKLAKSEDILTFSNNILIKPFEYKTDGLIFTPSQMPVGAIRLNNTPKLMRATWPLVLKWKPPHENTIDFMVHVLKANGVELTFDSDSTGGLEKHLLLYVAAENYATNAEEYFTKERRYKGIIPKLFQPPTSNEDHQILTNVNKMIIKLDDENKMKCVNGDDIRDGYIVEACFDLEKNSWIANKVRKDKNEIFQQTKRIENTANYATVANNIWRSIINPVKVDHITGKIKFVPADIKDDQYYVRKGSRNDSLMLATRNFHNDWVKTETLLGKFTNFNNFTLMDIGCGTGGDIKKWISAGFKTVLGIDLFNDNINGIEDGVYKRMSELMEKDLSYVFLPMDASKLIDSSYIKSISSPFYSELAKCIWGLENAKHESIKKFYKLGLNQFDVVSCQFAIHYFFKNNETLTNFVKNVAAHVKENGYFIGTGFDGQAVHQLLKDYELNKSVKGIFETELVWEITKKYEDYDGRETGKTIGVYVESINQRIDEYLMSFERLQEELGKFNIKLLTKEDREILKISQSESTGMFGQLYEQMKESNIDEKRKKAMKLKVYEEDHSFLNRWFIFKKYPNESPTKSITKPKTKPKPKS